jgi:peroxiredoxin
VRDKVVDRRTERNSRCDLPHIELSGNYERENLTMIPKRIIPTLTAAVRAYLIGATLFHSAMQAQSTDRPPSLAGVKIFSAPLNEGADLIGSSPGEWKVRDWLNSEPLALEALRGQVVLVRWWTAPGCVFCEGSAPALNDFWKRYRSRGLVVVGLYHHKSAEPLRLADVKKQSRKLGFEFPVAIDPDWTTLHRWWLDQHDRGWTSVTFLLDQRGVIRYVHPGGAFFKGEAGYDALERKIEALLTEPIKT